MTLSNLIVNEVGRILNGKSHPHEIAIGNLSTAAARAAESLVYLAEIDDRRFRGVWPTDVYANDGVDDGHVRWAAASALTTLDLCVAAAGRLTGFAQRPPAKEDSIRDFYSASPTGRVVDKRHLVLPPWRSWLDAVVADPQYDRLLRVRNALMHADAFRVIHATTSALAGHSLRFGYSVASLSGPPPATASASIGARTIVELSRDIAVKHASAFLSVLKNMP